MKRIIRLLAFWILMFVPVFLIDTTIKFGLTRIKNNYLNPYINKQFELNSVVDSLGNKATLNFNTKITIIDFWFRECPECIHELKQFEALLKGKETDASIYSISIDNEKDWKTLFSNNRLSFLKSNMQNWKQYAFDSSLVSPHAYLYDKYNIKSYPSYLVIDHNGKIIQVTESAVSYIKEKYYHSNWFMSLWRDKFYLDDYHLIKIVFLSYTILFWLIVVVFLGIKKKSAKSSDTDNYN
ncbi:MAG: thioredoxin-like domain-containing protein [Paludibacter sp.]|nr:thioredoxin-like domain-containing protein [Paludibacter sp.]